MTQNIQWDSPQGIQADYQMELDNLQWGYEEMGYNPQTGQPMPPGGMQINPQTGQPMIRPAMVAPSRLPTNLSKFAMPALLVGGGLFAAWLLTRK